MPIFIGCRFLNIKQATKIEFGTKSRYCDFCYATIDDNNETTTVIYHCKCLAMSYCSRECRLHHTDHLDDICNKIIQLKRDIHLRTQRLWRFHPSPGASVEDLYDHTSVWSNDEQRHIHAGEELRNKRKELLYKRRILIEELMHAGSSSSRYAGEYTNQNVRSYDIACRQSLDRLLLRRGGYDAELVLNIHLLTGKFEEVYNLSCHYMRKDREVLSGDGLNMIWQKEVRHENITKSFVQQKVREENTRFVKLDSIHWDAMVHIFLVKYMLHMSMENLHRINTNFLDNKDCINLIGEYMGLKKGWIITDNSNWYRDQAHEVAHLIHCADFYHNNAMESEDGPDWHESFDSVSRVAEQYFPGKSSVIDTAVKIGKECITDFKLQQNFLENKAGMKLISEFVGKDALIMAIRWKELIKCYEADRMLIYTLVIKSLLYHATKRINILAGWDAMGTNVNPFQCITEFVTEAMRLCENRGCTFQDIFPHEDWEFDGREEMDLGMGQ